ncbi:MAG: murein hydrolase activator EnvC family protein [Erysipelotrichaceae bacterium]
MKKISLFLLAFALLVFQVNPTWVEANSQFAGNEAYWINYCSQILQTDEDVQLCRDFKRYYAQLNDSLQGNLNQLEKELDKVKNDINNLIATVNGLNKQITVKDGEIKAVETSITKMEENIKTLEEAIIQTQADIDERNAQIQERMVVMQKFIGINGYIDFVMGAKDLVDMIRRATGVEKITSYDKEQIALLQADMAQLEADKAELERQKQELDDRKTELDQAKANLLEMKRVSEKYVSEFKKQEADYEAKLREIQVSISTIANNMPNINTSKPGDLPQLDLNNGFYFPVSGSYYKSAGTWYYPASFGGGLHQGVDYAASVGTALVAPANAYVAYANNPCPTYSAGIGDRCGYPLGGGNTVLMIMDVNGVTYAVHYSHMARENFYVKGQSTVSKGQVLGGMGTSGNSTGSHVHIEVINLGTKGAANALIEFNRTGDFNFGTGWSGGYRCENGSYNSKGYCKERPEKIFGV